VVHDVAAGEAELGWSGARGFHDLGVLPGPLRKPLGVRPLLRRTTGPAPVTGDRLALALERVTGVHPTGSAARAGERWEYRWSRFRDQLELRAFPGAISPGPFRVKPWRRVE
jgi:hypothetical protein